jgi:hypothetical protein
MKICSAVLELLHSDRWTDKQGKAFLQLLVTNMPKDYHICRTFWSLTKINVFKVFPVMHSLKDKDLHSITNTVQELPYPTLMKKE